MSQRSPFNKRNNPVAAAADEKPAKTGMARSGASQAKPAREAASSVRVVKVKKDKMTGGTTTQNMTKEEKKELKRKEREEEDQVISLSEKVTKNNPVYKKRRMIWWGMMAAGVVFVAISFAATYYGGEKYGNAYDFTKPIGVISMISLGLAYAGIIGAFVWDLAKLRPIRRETEEEISRMSQKRRVAILQECEDIEAQKKAEKAAKKAAKKSAK